MFMLSCRNAQAHDRHDTCMWLALGVVIIQLVTS